MFAVDCVLCRTVSQLFACVSVPCVSNWCEETDLFWGDHVQWSSPDMVDEIESAWESHIVLLYEWLQNFETKEPIRREWCKLLKKARTAYPSATTTLAVAQLQMSFFVCKKTRITRKQYAENISQLYDKNSWGFCQRSIPLKVHDTDLAAQEAHYHSTCRRDYTREDDRHQDPTKDTKTIEEQASNKTICFQYVTGRIV